MAQTADDGRIDLFRMRRDTSRTPDLNATHRVLVHGLEIAGQPVLQSGQVEHQLRVLSRPRLDDALYAAKAAGRDTYRIAGVARPGSGSTSAKGSAEVTPGAPRAAQPPRQSRGG